MIKALFCSLIVALAAPIASADDFGKLSPFVPTTGKANAEVMVLDAPADINQISDRVEQAIQENSEWFRAYAAQATPGKPLPYHKNMGITQQDYVRLLQGANELVLTKAGEVEITFSLETDGTIVLRGLPMTAPNHQLVYDPESNHIITAHGVLTDLRNFDQDNPEMPAGRWAGLQWNLNELPSATDFVQIKLSIGRLKDQKLNIIYYDVDVARHGTHDNYHYILLYGS
ncbi:MAG: hypothetical protein OER80_11275 [Gammaproteobacteria bacterium]|nr:hypothetical protein [Gammaproteobacteria bacterium]